MCKTKSYQKNLINFVREKETQKLKKSFRIIFYGWCHYSFELLCKQNFVSVIKHLCEK